MNERTNFHIIEGQKRHHYIVVASLNSNKVACIFKGPKEIERNIHNIGKIFASSIDNLLEKYNPAQYDMAIIKANNLKSIERALPEFHGWRSKSIEKIYIK